MRQRAQPASRAVSARRQYRSCAEPCPAMAPVTALCQRPSPAAAHVAGDAHTVDSDSAVPHARHVRLLARRLAALALVAIAFIGDAAVCQGWSLTGEARLACCAGDDPCPMHGESAGGPESRRALSQSEADSCCAMSEERRSPQTPPANAAPAGADLGPGFVVVPPPPRLVSTGSRFAGAHLSSASRHKHVLLSVFLI
jgi:hypothetical protein